MRLSKLFSLGLLALLPAAGHTADSAGGAAMVEGKAADGTRFYEDSLIIHASAARLWSAFTDEAEYRRWAVPVASIDFRLGGAIEASYDPKGRLGDPQNVKNVFIAYIPERLLVFRNVQAPAALPGGEFYGKTVKTLEFQPLGPTETRVTVSGVGFGSGEGFDRLYQFFSKGDGQMLGVLKHAMEERAAE